MGFIIIGIGSITGMGLNGAILQILQILSHGLIGAALFFLAGTSCDRIRFVYLEEMGGISIPMPKMLITFVMEIGMILTPIYLLSMLRQIFYGYKLFNIPNSNFFDSGPRELFVLICIFLPVIGIGFYPDFVLPLSVDKVQVLLSNSFYRY
uniref:NADH dehydrogenase subunit D n=1 Tax=Dendrobium bensoniae TaxID=859507 RepID=UPI0023D8AE0A|nr:NADH dehydrogenase subunit D [Dendrobium bensoniae]WDE21390.1 NADH dehydrogenase subunit D [Dendrobium bensoniae]